MGLGESAWDVMGAWPVLIVLGAVTTLDWTCTPLAAKLRLVIGKPGLVQTCRPAFRAV